MKTQTKREKRKEEQLLQKRKQKKMIKAAIILEMKPGPFGCIKINPGGMTVYVNFQVEAMGIFMSIDDHKTLTECTKCTHINQHALIITYILYYILHLWHRKQYFVDSIYL